jgi:transposase
MPQSRPLDVGMDVHTESSAVASVAQEHDAAVLSLGTCGPRQCDLATLMRQRPSKAKPLVFVSAAGPCGSWRSRSLTNKDDICWVVAPSLMPQKAGDRVHTDRRDAMPLARLLRAGALPPVSVPALDAAALRDLRRAREETLRELTAAKLRLQACLLRHDIRLTGRATWSPAPRRWRSAGGCPPPAQPSVFPADVQPVTAQTERLGRLALARHAQGNTWRCAPGVEALQALRGVPCTVAVTTGAARGDLPRVETPRQRMPSLGLTPSAYARGARRQQGSSTKTGHAPARRALVAGAWASRYPATSSRHRQRRLEKLPTAIQAIRWKAQVRRCQRERQLRATGKHAHQVVVAMARALRACMWAMAQQVAGAPQA